MKFAGKYELHESVTSGPVETFVAHALATNERVLVHVFECQHQQSDQPTIVWVLDAFRAIAPEPLGTVVDAGQYGDTSYVYLVTKLPKDVDLQRWLRHYERDCGTTPKIALPPSHAPTEPSRSNSHQNPRTPGEFTKAFLEFNTGPDPAKKANAVVGRISGANTGSQMSPMEESGTPGEFTQFFKGPFNGDRPAEMPDVLPPPPPQQHRVGEFTLIFGPEKKDTPPAPSPLLNDTPRSCDPGELSQVSSDGLVKSSGSHEPSVTPQNPLRAANDSSEIPEPVWDSGVAVTVNPPPTPSPRPTPLPRSTLEGGYTEIIRRPEPPSAPQELLRPANEEKPVESKVPSPPPVPAPKPPVPLPQPSKTAGSPLGAPPVSYLPLILILVISFFLAALVVLFFALKH